MLIFGSESALGTALTPGAGRIYAWQFTLAEARYVEELDLKQGTVGESSMTALFLGVAKDASGAPGEVIVAASCGAGLAKGAGGVSKATETRTLLAPGKYWALMLPTGGGTKATMSTAKYTRSAKNSYTELKAGMLVPAGEWTLEEVGVNSMSLYGFGTPSGEYHEDAMGGAGLGKVTASAENYAHVDAMGGAALGQSAGVASVLYTDHPVGTGVAHGEVGAGRLGGGGADPAVGLVTLGTTPIGTAPGAAAPGSAGEEWSGSDTRTGELSPGFGWGDTYEHGEPEAEETALGRATAADALAHADAASAAGLGRPAASDQRLTIDAQVNTALGQPTRTAKEIRSDAGAALALGVIAGRDEWTRDPWQYSDDAVAAALGVLSRGEQAQTSDTGAAVALSAAAGAETWGHADTGVAVALAGASVAEGGAWRDAGAALALASFTATETWGGASYVAVMTALAEGSASEAAETVDAGAEVLDGVSTAVERAYVAVFPANAPEPGHVETVRRGRL